MNKRLHKTVVTGISGTFLTACLFFLVYACSSDNKPIAEMYLGEWTIFSKTGETENDDVTGNIHIDLGNEIVTFDMTYEDETENISLSGIVYNNSLYADSTRKILLGKLDIVNGILRITLTDYDGMILNARSIFSIT